MLESLKCTCYSLNFLEVRRVRAGTSYSKNESEKKNIKYYKNFEKNAELDRLSSYVSIIPYKEERVRSSNGAHQTFHHTVVSRSRKRCWFPSS